MRAELLEVNGLEPNLEEKKTKDLLLSPLLIGWSGLLTEESQHDPTTSYYALLSNCVSVPDWWLLSCMGTSLQTLSLVTGHLMDLIQKH
ncbi:hypothetical protein F2P81_011798 [Scophthalmus maximus]|uniref:Uncharacterized protein n=1 Tax=Scophthalmus maximus TaxID=52904 RepID=A0A6A4SMR0_SCOMX|nr:hypothetical protein F2P81_011798 [Scophthalmus maximus]